MLTFNTKHVHFGKKNEPDFLRSGPFKIYCHDYRLSNAAFTSA